MTHKDIRRLKVEAVDGLWDAVDRSGCTDEDDYNYVRESEDHSRLSETMFFSGGDGL